MLYLTRRQGEAVVINNDIEVRVVELRGRTVKLGFTFPPSATVMREELFLLIRDANQDAADAVKALGELTATSSGAETGAAIASNDDGAAGKSEES